MANIHLTIGKKIGFGFAIILIMITVLLGISRYAQITSATRFTNLLQGENVVITHAYSAKIALLEARRNEKDLLYATDDSLVKTADKFITQLHSELDTVNSLVLKSADSKLVEMTPKLLVLSEDYQKHFKAMVEAQPGQARMIAALSVRKTAQAMESLLKDLLEGVSERIERETLSTQSYISSIGTIALLAGILTMIVGGLLAFFIPRAITRPLNLMQKIISEVEQTHDLTRRIPAGGQDEVGMTADAFNRLMIVMQGALGNILRSVGEVSEAAQNLSTSSNHVAQSSAQQNEAASAMASTVEGVAVSIKQVSENAHQAQQISSKSGELSKQGGAIIDETTAEMLKIADAVRQTSAAIENLSNQSSQISSVVLVIKELADQTNLLALNAAIEAARAGEQGRGFAVVADEVRKLAESTTQSTDEIRKVVEAIQNTTSSAVVSMGSTVTQVNAGVERAQQAGDSIKQIREGAEQVIRVINDITSALVAQANASNQIATNVERVTQMTEENKVSTHETAGEADHLKRLAETMRISVNQFKI